MRKTKRVLSVLLAVMVLLAVVPVGNVGIIASATQTRSENFYDAEYDSNPGQYMVSIAEAQLGRTGSSLGYTEEWCADFVSDCAKIAGQSDAIPANGLVSTLADNILNAGGTIVSAQDAKPGDICIIDWADVSGYNNHVEIVYKVEGSSVYTIGGNTGVSDANLYTRKVARHTPISSSNIYKIIRPKYCPARVSVPEGIYTIQSVKEPTRVLDIESNSTARGANIQLFDWDGTNVQKFKVVNKGDYYCIQSVYSGMWLDIAYPYNEDQCNIQLWDTNTSTEQKWVFEDAGNGNVYIHSLYGMYLDTGGPTDNRTNIRTYHFDETPSQQWTLIKTSPSNKLTVTEGIYEFHNVKNPARVLDIKNNSTENGAQIQLFDDLNAPVQQFKVVKNGYGYSIQSVYSGYWLDIKTPCNVDNCNIQLWFKNTEREQKWTFEDAGNGNVYIRSFYGLYVDTGGPTDNRKSIVTYHYDATASQQWTMHRVYNVTYDANGGTGGPSNQYKQSDINLTLSSTTPSRDGYAFVKWNTKADGTGTGYNPNSTYSGNADLTLYAIWKANHTHSYTSAVTTAATCSKAGERTYTCSCGASYTETIPINSSNHVNTTNVSATASTCTVKGYTAGVYCNDCKRYISGHAQQPLAAHQTVVINAREATYDAEGYTGDDYCTVCQQTIHTGTSIPKLTRPTDPTPTDPTPQPQSGGCKWCGGNHGGAFGWLVRIIHNILAAIFGARY